MRVLVSILLVGGILGVSCSPAQPRGVRVPKEPCVIVIQVQSSTINAPATVSCARDSQVLFVFVNGDGTPHEIAINAGDIFDKNDTNHAKKNPFDSGETIGGTVPGFDVTSMKRHVKPLADKTTYKYTVTCSGCQSLDPDLEIAM